MRSIAPLLAVALAAAAPAVAAQVVPVAQFDSLELRGGGDVVVVRGPMQRVTVLEGSPGLRVERGGKLRIDACPQRCPPGYRLRMEIQSPRVPDLGVIGGGSIATRPGFAAQPELAVAVNGGGRIDARSVDAGSVSAAVNGGGQLDVRARAMLTAAINGGGLVRYAGNPQVTSAVHGGGAVIRSLQ